MEGGKLAGRGAVDRRDRGWDVGWRERWIIGVRTRYGSVSDGMVEIGILRVVNGRIGVSLDSGGKKTEARTDLVLRIFGCTLGLRARIGHVI
jgi:hypothetical protein